MSDIPVEIVSPELLECGEGPMWDPVRRQLYWTNATGQAIYRYDRRREEVGLLTEQVQAAGIALHEDGGLILGGGSGFLYWNGDEAIRVIADTCDGRPVTSINDIIADPAGRVFGGQEAYREDEPYEPGYLFRVDPDGSIRIVEEGLHISNGIGFSPETQRFYLIDSVPRRVYASPAGAASLRLGALVRRRPFPLRSGGEVRAADRTARGPAVLGHVRRRRPDRALHHLRGPALGERGRTGGA